MQQLKKTNNQSVVPGNIQTHPKNSGNSEGEGVSIAKNFKGKYEAQLEFPGGLEGPNQ